MLEPQVASGAWHRWLVRSSLACGMVVAAIGGSRMLAPDPIVEHVTDRVPVLIPTPTIIQVAAAAEDPDPNPPPAEEPAVVHTACVGDVANLGLPRGSDDLAGSDSSPVLQATASSDACTLAAWNRNAIDISWDGGQTFAHYDLDADVTIEKVAVTAARVVIVSAAGDLGTVHAGDDAFTWRTPARIAQDIGPSSKLFAANGFTVLAIEHEQAQLAAVTTDDGATWTYLQPPVADATFVGLAATGQLAAERLVYSQVMDGALDATTERWMTDLAHPAWHRGATVTGHIIGRGKQLYVTRIDQFWGCGGSEKLIWLHGGHETKLAGAMRPEGWTAPLAIAEGGDAVYLQRNDAIESLGGGGVMPVVPGAVLVGADAAGTAIATDGLHLLRWSPRGGWRVLFTAP